ncbi:MAG: hypothetical protein H7222_01430 [Methylotenera sp.]|nr:hypothetical protein [Oligoflexia bacterium]
MKTHESPILKLMQSLNRCLEKMLVLSEEFLKEADARKALPDLTRFEAERETILRGISLFDRKITEAATTLPKDARTSQLISTITTLLDAKMLLVEKIVRVDAAISQKIEEAQAEITKKIQNSRKSKEVLGKFKSTWVNENGEEVDTTL